jgi:hypothetical protein
MADLIRDVFHVALCNPWLDQGNDQAALPIPEGGRLVMARYDNATWMVARHGYKTPDQVRAEQRAVDEHTATDVLLAA